MADNDVNDDRVLGNFESFFILDSLFMSVAELSPDCSPLLSAEIGIGESLSERFLIGIKFFRNQLED